MSGRDGNSAVGTAVPNTWALMPDEIANDEKHTGTNANQTLKMFVRTSSPVATLSEEHVRPLTQLEVKSVLEATKQVEIKSMSRDLREETIRDTSAARYCATAEGVENSTLFFVENKSTEMNICGVLHETLSQCLSRTP